MKVLNLHSFFLIKVTSSKNVQNVIPSSTTSQKMYINVIENKFKICIIIMLFRMKFAEVRSQF